MVKARRVQQADVIRPERMEGRRRGSGQHGEQRAQRLRLAVARLGHDAHAAVLRQRATGPAMLDVRLEPAGCEPMMHVVAVVQRDQHARAPHARCHRRAHKAHANERRRAQRHRASGIVRGLARIGSPRAKRSRSSAIARADP